MEPTIFSYLAFSVGTKLSLKKWRVQDWCEVNLWNHLSIGPYSLKLFYCLYKIQYQNSVTDIMDKYHGRRIFIQTDVELLVITL